MNNVDRPMAFSAQTPQRQVAAALSAFWSHSRYNSFLERLERGVVDLYGPSILTIMGSIPLCVDNRCNALGHTVIVFILAEWPGILQGRIMARENEESGDDNSIQVLGKVRGKLRYGLRS